MTPKHHVFGIRHHGPGSARSLLHALEQISPDIVLIEGPPDADALLSFTIDEEMRPPVALLVYVQDQPRRAVFYPMAEFSPEWVAINFAHRQKIPVRSIDLPQSNQFALEPVNDTPLPRQDSVQQDPLSYLAKASGHEDFERWWEATFEQRLSDLDIFNAIAEAMSALRDNFEPNKDPIEELREASMRQNIRKAVNQGYSNIAVVCGAWHVPSLLEIDRSKVSDGKLLNKLPVVKTVCAWVPWTNARLSLRSGYGAGIYSPGWYSHLWSSKDNVTTLWMTKVAHLLRQHDLDSSPAHIIEAIRLAETLAALRNLSIPGLDEMNEAAQTVFCFGSSLPMRVIHEKLIVGNTMGIVPSPAPVVPLQQDLLREQKRLRLPAEPDLRMLDLDLRKPTDLDRSYLLHRIALLGIPWGRREKVSGAKGTFHEIWQIQWQPEFAVAIIEASLFGSTVADASAKCAFDQAKSMKGVSAITTLLQNAMLADLPFAVDAALSRLEAEAAVVGDIGELMDALPPLIGVLRYGSVRKTEKEMVAKIVESLTARISIGLPFASRSLDDESANEMFSRLIAVNTSLNFGTDESILSRWYEALNAVSLQDGVHGLINGRCTRLLLDAIQIDHSVCSRSMAQALSPGNSPLFAAAWIDGFLRSSGQILLLDISLWSIINKWIISLSEDVFLTMIPLIRRTFSTFAVAERRQIGEMARSDSHSIQGEQDAGRTLIDTDLADRSLPLLRKLLGLNPVREVVIND